MKRALSFVLSLVMGFSVLTVSASAAQKPDGSPAQETFSIKGRQASSAMVEMLEEEGIPVTEDTVIELVPLSSTESGVSPQSSNGGSDGNVLVITNEEGSTVRKDTLLLFTDDGIGFADMNEVMARANSHGATEKYDEVVVRGTAFFERRSNGVLFYRPLEVQFSYKKSQDCVVGSMGVCYECSGGVHTYPGLVDTGKITTYSIECKEVLPVEGKMYRKEKPYPSDFVICPGAGGTSPGSNLTFETIVNGNVYLHSVPIY